MRRTVIKIGPLLAWGGLLLLAGTALAGEAPGETADTIPALVARLGHESYRVREEAFELLYIEGEDALPALKTEARSEDPEIRRRSNRLLFLIRWRISPAEFRRIGTLWDDFESLPARGRIRRILELETLKIEEGVQLLRRTAEIDPHEAVRDQARRSLGKLLLFRLNSEGCNLMKRGEFKAAEAKFEQILELDPGNPIACYNLACSRSLQNDVEGALRHLELALKNGYRDFSWAREDEDLENLRKDPRFEALLRRGWKD